MSIYPEFSKELIAAIKTHHNFLVVGHSHPDGDCINSGIALSILLKGIDSTNVVTRASSGPFNKSEIKREYDLFETSLTANYLKAKPFVCIVDCSELSRVDAVLPQEYIEENNFLILDHHGSSSLTGPLIYVSAESISTTLIIQKLAQDFKWNINKEFALAVLRGFITDSGCFRFLRAPQNETFKLIDKLITPFNLSISTEYEYLNFGKSFQSVKYLTALLQRCKTYCNGQLLISENFQEDDKNFEGVSLPADSFYSQTLSLEKVRVVVLLKYKDDNLTNLGLRSTHSSNVDVAKIATTIPNRANEGGGHIHAAGVNLALDMPTTKKTVINYISKFL